jgi:hypothetical protein
MEVNRLRDVRLDFLRGLAICMIFVDHVTGDPLAKFTYQAIGFSDAAEIFVLVSGLACGIAYSRTFARKGGRGLADSMLRRIARIYAYYALTTLVVVSLAILAMKYVGMREFYGFKAEETVRNFLRALAMAEPTPYAGILVLYIILTAVVVPAFVCAKGHAKFILLAVSALIWCASQVVDTTVLTPNLVFNPFAWQFLFAIGVVFGINREAGSPVLSRVDELRWPLVLAWSVVLVALLIKILSFRSFFDVGALRLDPSAVEKMKQNLAPVRLVHFLSVAYLVATYFRRDSKILKFRLASPLITMGMYSLQVFCLSLVLTYLLNILVLVHKPSLAEWLVLDVVAFAALALGAAAAAHQRRTRLQVAPRQA